MITGRRLGRRQGCSALAAANVVITTHCADCIFSMTLVFSFTNIVINIVIGITEPTTVCPTSVQNNKSTDILTLTTKAPALQQNTTCFVVAETTVLLSSGVQVAHGAPMCEIHCKWLLKYDVKFTFFFTEPLLILHVRLQCTHVAPLQHQINISSISKCTEALQVHTSMHDTI